MLQGLGHQNVDAMLGFRFTAAGTCSATRPVLCPLRKRLRGLRTMSELVLGTSELAQDLVFLDHASMARC
jgi:hypothetical protein